MPPSAEKMPSPNLNKLKTLVQYDFFKNSLAVGNISKSQPLVDRRRVVVRSGLALSAQFARLFRPIFERELQDASVKAHVYRERILDRRGTPLWVLLAKTI